MTKLKNIISTTTARRNFFQITEEVQKPGNYFTLTQNGEAKAVIVSAEEFESMQETIEILSENPNLLNDIKQSEKELKAGDYSNFISFDEYLKQDGFAVAEKGGEYVIQHTAHEKSDQKSRKTPSKK